jgi:uncharacterized membrane protein YgaE (UPF0421/DUF939 family)
MNDAPQRLRPSRIATAGTFVAVAIAGLALVLTSDGIWFLAGAVLITVALTAEAVYRLAVTARHR